MPKKFLIYTDLDGTLLDHDTYSFHPAEAALKLLENRNIPLIICTSKTRAEIEFFKKLLGNQEPFISENGGGIFIPEGYFEHEFEFDRVIRGYKVIEFGTPAHSLRQALEDISLETGIEVRGFSQMSVSELSELTGLDEYTAQLSKLRDYSEPFLIYGDDKDTETVVEKINLIGYRHTRGGRFHHILGENDKGKAVRTLTDIYVNELGEATTIGLGDSLNDQPMLREVDIPVLVQKPGGEYQTNIGLRNIHYAEGAGPYGWNAEVLKIFMNS
jgi:mannosyl-3-phosphoglycerate phosphatase